MWTEAEYLAFDGNVMLEFERGFVEVLPVPTTSHQRVAALLLRKLFVIADAVGGEALMAPLKVQVGEESYREPDLLYVSATHRVLIGEQFWTGADLVMEVVSPDNPERDYWKKRNDYAAAGIAEYWIVDPQRQLITVLTLRGSEYAEAGAYKPGETAASVLLTDLKVDVTACLAAGQ